MTTLLLAIALCGQCPGGVCRPQTTAAPVLYMDSWRSQAGAAVSIPAPQARPVFVRRGLFGRRYVEYRSHGAPGPLLPLYSAAGMCSGRY